MKNRNLIKTVLLVVAFAPVAAGGETVKFQAKHINVSTKNEAVEVGDEPGHVIAFFEAKGVGSRYQGPGEQPYKIEIWGTGDYRSDGTGKGQGYGKFIFADGSSYYERWTSTLKDGHDVGTAVYYNGTGRFEGMTGGSKYDCSLMGDRFICDVHGVIELP